MIKVDLITGFLGAGKTTFLKKYAKYLMEQGQKICILENDFGAVNVDMLLLQDLLGEQCELEMVAGACDADCHKRRFKTKLISMGMRGFDRVMIEPSGIFDVDEFFDSLREEPLDRWYEIGSVISIVDAGLREELTQESKFLLASQVAGAGKLILSKRQEVDEPAVDRTIELINRALSECKCRRSFTKEECLMKDWAQLSSVDYEEIMSCGYVSESYTKLWFDQKECYQSLYFMHVDLSKENLQNNVQSVLQDAACGKVFRIKGFVPAEEGKWYEINATKDNMECNPVEKGQEVIIVIGEELVEERIEEELKKEAKF